MTQHVETIEYIVINESTITRNHKELFEDDPCSIQKNTESLHQVTALELKPSPSLCFHQYLDGFDWEGFT